MIAVQATFKGLIPLLLLSKAIKSITINVLTFKILQIASRDNKLHVEKRTFIV